MEHPNLEDLSLHDGEEGFVFDFDEEEEEQVDLRWCLVGRFICERAVHFNSMKVRMADLWRLVKGSYYQGDEGWKVSIPFCSSS
jgi:hypothetical protein